MSGRTHFFFVIVLFFVFQGCNGPEQGVQPSSGSTEAPVSSDSASDDPLVDSRINENFRSENLDVQQYIQNFEGESREVFFLRKAIVDYLNMQAGDSIADIGAGTGFYSRLFADRVGTGGKVYAVDISPRFIDHIQTTSAEMGLTQIEAILGSDTSPNLPENTLDAVFMCDTYHHFESPESMLANIHSALKPDGRVFLLDFKRIPGQTTQWMMDHVRGGKEVFRAEIEAAGFTYLDEASLGLRENYLISFKKNSTP